MLLQITSGKGPLECELAVGKFLKVLRAELMDLKIVSQIQSGYADCYKSVVIETFSQQAAGVTGTVKWIAQSPFRPKHKRKNWFIGVTVIGEPAQPCLEDGLVRYETFHSGGKGGQNVNKVETGVRVVHMATGLSVVSTQGRDQHTNKKLALIRLSEIIMEQNMARQQKQKQALWIQHELVERGKPIRVYEGSDFHPLS